MVGYARSDSFPSKPHPIVENFEDPVIRIKSSAEATSSSASSYINNKKGTKQFSPKAVLDMGQDHKTITDTLKEAEAIGFSFLKPVMMLICGEKASSKARSWSLVSKFTLSSRVHFEMHEENNVQDFNILNIHKSLKSMDAVAVPDFLKQLTASEMAIK
ncbi:UNVERIFIED_CONTAM: hypothetical protein Sangu_2290200 [Sesamum angustifolium]|uniref:Uncharacterized protein n=1 Tax=Sesamum angustifolium TaxID=2727405 RepID=A0AAW2L6P0_9LAMI